MRLHGYREGSGEGSGEGYKSHVPGEARPPAFCSRWPIPPPSTSRCVAPGARVHGDLAARTLHTLPTLQEHEYMETWQLVLVPSGCVVILAGILSVRIGAQAVVAPEAQKELALAGPNSSSDQGLANAT